jgi:chaperonin cofactor prefoldin
MEINPDFAFGVEQPDGSMLYQPNESVLITATIGAIKQLAEKNDALANRVSVLESQIAAMQSQINKLLD